MKAIVQDTYGSPDVLHVADVEKPVPGDAHLLIRVHAAGMDPGVWHLMTGLPYLVRLMGYGLKRPKARVPGIDVAGTVEAVGKDVTGFQPGDEVFGACEGAYAEYARVEPKNCAPKPENLTFAQAAAVPVSGCTALQGLRDTGRIQAGQQVLIIGAAGGVGSFAVQIAKAYGAEVTGVCRTAKTDLVRSLGADHVIDYSREDFADGPRRWDLIFDTGGNRPLSHLRRALTPRGTLVIVGGEGGGRWIAGADRQLRGLLLSLFVRQNLRTFLARITAENLRVLKDLIEAGKVTPAVDRTFPLSEAAEAIRYWESGRVRGKVVLTV